jgi:hypothetical protein
MYSVMLIDVGFPKMNEPSFCLQKQLIAIQLIMAATHMLNSRKGSSLLGFIVSPTWKFVMIYT